MNFIMKIETLTIQVDISQPLKVTSTQVYCLSHHTVQYESSFSRGLQREQISQ